MRGISHKSSGPFRVVRVFRGFGLFVDQPRKARSTRKGKGMRGISHKSSGPFRAVRVFRGFGLFVD
jgi:hypothetical protein